MATVPNPYGRNMADVTLELGLISFSGATYTIKDAGEGAKAEVHSVCPTCTTPKTFMGARLVCLDNPKHGPFEKAEIMYGQQVGDKIVVLTPEQIDEARTSILPAAVLQLQVHERADVEAHTFPAGNAYVFVPKGPSMPYGLLITLLKERRDLCLIAKTNLRKKDHLMMVDVELNGQLVLREMMWPEDMKSFDTPVVDVDEKTLNLGTTLLESMVTPFDPAEYRTDSRARISELVATAAGAKKTRGKKAPAAASQPADNLLSLLEAAVAARPKKTTRTRKAS